MASGAACYPTVTEAIATVFALMAAHARSRHRESENAPVRTDTLAIDANTVIFMLPPILNDAMTHGLDCFLHGIFSLD